MWTQPSHHYRLNASLQSPSPPQPLTLPSHQRLRLLEWIPLLPKWLKIPRKISLIKRLLNKVSRLRLIPLKNLHLLLSLKKKKPNRCRNKSRKKMQRLTIRNKRNKKKRTTTAKARMQHRVAVAESCSCLALFAPQHMRVPSSMPRSTIFKSKKLLSRSASLLKTLSRTSWPRFSK